MAGNSFDTFQLDFSKLGYGGRKNVAEQLLRDNPITGDPPRGRHAARLSHAYQGMGPLTWWITEQMRVDDQVSLGLAVRNGLLSHLEIEIDEERIKTPKAQRQSEWAMRNWRFLWEHHGKKLRQTKLAGHGAFEMFYKSGAEPGQIDIARVKALHPIDVRPLRSKGRTVGAEVRHRSNVTVPGTSPKILAPKLLWTTFGARYERPWGESVFEPSYRPWYLKWMEHGTEELTTLWYVKYAASGRILWVGDGMLEMDDEGNKFPMMDLLRSLGENELALSTVVLPLRYDNNGNKLIEYGRPEIPSSTNPFEWWANETGRRIWKGMGILPEVIEALGTGSFSGRSIPLVAMLDGLMDEARELFDGVCQMVFDPLCSIMDGGEPEYAIKLVPLTRTVGEDMKGGGEGGGTSQNVTPIAPNTQRTIGRDSGNESRNRLNDGRQRDRSGRFGSGEAGDESKKRGFTDREGKFHATVSQFSEDTDSTDPTVDRIIGTAAGLAEVETAKGRRRVIDLLKKKRNSSDLALRS